MPLTEQMRRCLELINGQDGIVSTIGSVPHMRGDPDIRPPTPCVALDTLVKLFFKGPEPTIYVAIVHDIMSQIIHISYPGRPSHSHNPDLVSKARALTQTDVDMLFELFRTLLSNPTVELKIQLFKEMYCKGNDILMQQLIDKRAEEQQKLYMGQPNHYGIVKSLLQQNLSLSALEKIIASDESIVVIQLIDDLFPNIQELVQFLEQQIVVMPHTTGPNHHYYAIHVEVKGLHHAREESPESEQFNIGLARRDNQLPGCCAGCATEFDTLEHVRHYVINRTADFHENFPPHNYQVSQNVTADAGVFTKFVSILHAKCSDIVQEEVYQDLVDHPFFGAASALLGSSTDVVASAEA